MTNHNGSPDQSALLADLVSRLEDAREIYAPELPDHGRFAAKAALGACIMFAMRAIPNGLDLVLPLRDLLDGIDDLAKGHIAPMLEYQPKQRMRHLPRQIETFGAMAAVLMELNLRSLGREAAAEKAAQDLNERGFRDERGNPIAAKRLEDWRDTAKEGGDRLGAKRFKDYVKKLSAVDEQRAREEVFRSLAAIPGSRIPNGPPAIRNPLRRRQFHLAGVHKTEDEYSSTSGESEAIQPTVLQ
jgi:hypothetical protein